MLAGSLWQRTHMPSSARVLLWCRAARHWPLNSRTPLAFLRQVALFPAQCGPWLLAPESAAIVARVLAGQHLIQPPEPAETAPAVLQQPLLEALATSLEVRPCRPRLALALTHTQHKLVTCALHCTKSWIAIAAIAQRERQLHGNNRHPTPAGCVALQAGGTAPSEPLMQLYEVVRQAAASSPDTAVRGLANEVATALSAVLR